jgi:hypothetical protein
MVYLESLPPTLLEAIRFEYEVVGAAINLIARSRKSLCVCEETIDVLMEEEAMIEGVYQEIRAEYPPIERATVVDHARARQGCMTLVRKWLVGVKPQLTWVPGDLFGLPQEKWSRG